MNHGLFHAEAGIRGKEQLIAHSALRRYCEPHPGAGRIISGGAGAVNIHAYDYFTFLLQVSWLISVLAISLARLLKPLERAAVCVAVHTWSIHSTYLLVSMFVRGSVKRRTWRYVYMCNMNCTSLILYRINAAVNKIIVQVFFLLDSLYRVGLNNATLDKC